MPLLPDCSIGDPADMAGSGTWPAGVDGMGETWLGDAGEAEGAGEEDRRRSLASMLEWALVPRACHHHDGAREVFLPLCAA